MKRFLLLIIFAILLAIPSIYVIYTLRNLFCEWKEERDTIKAEEEKQAFLSKLQPDITFEVEVSDSGEGVRSLNKNFDFYLVNKSSKEEYYFLGSDHDACYFAGYNVKVDYGDGQRRDPINIYQGSNFCGNSAFDNVVLPKCNEKVITIKPGSKQKVKMGYGPGYSIKGNYRINFNSGFKFLPNRQSVNFTVPVLLTTSSVDVDFDGVIKKQLSSRRLETTQTIEETIEREYDNHDRLLREELYKTNIDKDKLLYPYDQKVISKHYEASDLDSYVVEERFENDKKISEIQFYENEAIHKKKEVYWDNEGGFKLKEYDKEGNVTNELISRIEKEFYDDKVLKSEKYFENDTLMKQIDYDMNGSKKLIKEFYPNGQLRSECVHINGNDERAHKCNVFWENGNIKEGDGILINGKWRPQFYDERGVLYHCDWKDDGSATCPNPP